MVVIVWLMNLTINNSTTSHEVVSYTESGIYSYSTNNSVLVKVLNLTINNSSSSSDDVTTCDSYEWNGVTYTESEVYTFESTKVWLYRYYFE